MRPREHRRISTAPRALAVTALCLFLLPAAVSAADALNGRVLERQDDRLVPARKILVTATAGREILGAARTGPDGAFHITGPFSGKIRLAAERPGYLVIQAGDTTDPYLNADCAGPCGPFDFIIVRAAVVSGRVVDDLQQPLANASVRLGPADGEPGPPGLQARTDDRGRFRIPGVASGDYQLSASGPFRGLSQMGFETATETLSLQADEERFFEITLLPAGQAYFEVSGVVTGLEADADAARSVVLRPAGGAFQPGMRGRSIRAGRVDEEGRFTIDRVPSGEYFATLAQGGGRRRGGGPGSQSQTLLGRLEVRSDLSGVTLRPQPEAALSGRLEWEGAEPQRRPLLLESLDGAPPGFLRVQGDQTFQADGLYPGRYRISAGGPGGFGPFGGGFRGRGPFGGRPGPGGPGGSGETYIREVRVGDRTLPNAELDLSAGSLDDVVIVLSGATARLTGRIRAAEGQSAERFRVAVRGPSGVRTTQTDQNGRFEIEDLLPGDYEIGAWAGAGQDDVRSDSWWERMAPVLRRFPVEAGSDIDIELTAAP